MTARKRFFLIFASFLIFETSASVRASEPNIVFIYADDLGYGDVSCYGARALKTPNIDRLARDGLRFTDAHSSAATCTPSRYAMLTGEYAWRKKGTGVLPGDAALIIEPGRTTLPSILKRAGYHTGVVGKWHLGLGNSNLNWNAEIKPGPLELGFDYSFIMPATGDRVPCVYVEDHRVVGLDPVDPIQVSYVTPLGSEPTGKANPELLSLRPSHGHDMTIINGISRIGYMAGGRSARWKDEEMADVLTGKAKSFIEQNRDKPFFLYFALHDPHVPRVPHPRFAGRTTLGPRGDAIVQADWCVGEILDLLDHLKLADNTLVLFTSDNGPVVDDGYQDEAVERLGSHKPAGPWRGRKYSKFEGGTRVPLILRWRGHVKSGGSDALVCQVDFSATFAALTRQTLAKADAPDSFDLLRTLLGESKAGRDHLVEQANGLALRQGQWKYIPRSAVARPNQPANVEAGNDSAPQLYDLANDPGETNNLALAQPEKVKALGAQLEGIRTTGRSRP